MKIEFNILNLQIDLEYALKENKEWWFRNSTPQIPIDRKIEDLTEENKISLVKLAIYEGFLESDNLANMPKKSFNILK